ncbi:hypothetical protein ACJX0J_014747, partial [Zea mays]
NFKLLEDHLSLSNKAALGLLGSIIVFLLMGISMKSILSIFLSYGMEAHAKSIGMPIFFLNLSMPTLFLSTTSQYHVNRLHFPAIILFVMQNCAGFALLLGFDLKCVMLFGCTFWVIDADIFITICAWFAHLPL